MEIVLDSSSVLGGMGGGFLGALFAASILFFAVAIVLIYISSSYFWMTIGKKLKYKKAWLAWIPVANISMVLEMGKFHWAWVFLILLPILGWIPLLVLFVISNWRIFEKRGYPGWLSLILVLMTFGGDIVGSIAGVGYLVTLGFVALKEYKPEKMPKRK